MIRLSTRMSKQRVLICAIFARWSCPRAKRASHHTVSHHFYSFEPTAPLCKLNTRFRYPFEKNFSFPGRRRRGHGRRRFRRTDEIARKTRRYRGYMFDREAMLLKKFVARATSSRSFAVYFALDLTAMWRAVAIFGELLARIVLFLRGFRDFEYLMVLLF